MAFDIATAKPVVQKKAIFDTATARPIGDKKGVFDPSTARPVNGFGMTTEIPATNQIDNSQPVFSPDAGIAGSTSDMMPKGDIAGIYRLPEEKGDVIPGTFEFTAKRLGSMMLRAVRGFAEMGGKIQTDLAKGQQEAIKRGVDPDTWYGKQIDKREKRLKEMEDRQGRLGARTKIERDVDATRQAIIKNAQEKGLWTGISASVLDSATELGGLLAQLAIFKKIPGIKLTTGTGALSGLGRAVETGGIRAMMTPGETKERANQAIYMTAYNITPHIANATGATGLTAVAVDTALNTFLTSPTYLRLAQNTESPAEFLAQSIPQFVMDIGMALSTRGTPENQRIKAMWKANKEAGVKMSLGEYKDFVRAVDKISEKEGIEVKIPAVEPTKPAVNVKVIENIKAGDRIAGSLGGFITDKTIRDDFKDVLDVNIVVNPKLDKYRNASFSGLKRTPEQIKAGAPSGRIEVNPNLDEKTLVEAIFHEAIHAKRFHLGRGFTDAETEKLERAAREGSAYFAKKVEAPTAKPPETALKATIPAEKVPVAEVTPPKITEETHIYKDENGIPTNYLTIKAEPIKSTFDERLDFAHKQNLTHSEVDDFLILTSKGKIFDNARYYEGKGEFVKNKEKIKNAYLKFTEQKGNLAIPKVNIAEEARKYNTADEFVKAQGTPVYHGTQAKFDKFEAKFAIDAEGRKLNLGWGKNNFYFTTKKGEALKYATRERSPEVAKLYPKGEPNVIEAFVDIKKPFDIKIGENAERWRKVRDGYWTDGVSDFNYHKIPKGKTKAEAFVEQLKKEGYDGIIDGQEITAFSESSIKTKSQLIDIWNKAHEKPAPKPEAKSTAEAPAVKTEPLIEEAKKYKSADEFVKDQGKVKPSVKVEKIKPTKKEINLLLRAEHKGRIEQYEAEKENDFIDQLIAGELPAVDAAEGRVAADTRVIDASRDYFTPGVPLYKSGEWKSLPEYVRRRAFSRKGGMGLDEVAQAIGMTDNELFNKLARYRRPEKPGMGDPGEIRRYLETEDGQAELKEMREMSELKDISIEDLKKLIETRKAIKPKIIPEKIKKVYEKLKLAREGEKVGAVPSESVLLGDILKMEAASIKKAFKEGEGFSRKQSKEMQEQIIGAIEESGIPRSKMGTFIRTVKNIQTPKQLEKQMPVLIERLKNINVDFEKRSIAAHIARISEAKNIPADYKDQIDEMLEGLDMKVRKPGTIAKKESRADWLKRQKDEGDFVFLPDEFWDGLPKKTLNNMTLDELREIDNAVSMLVHAGRTKNKLLHHKDFIDNEKFVNDIVNRGRRKIRISEKTPKGEYPLVSHVEKASEKAKRVIGEFFSGHRKAEYILRHFGAGKVFEIMQYGKNAREKNLLELRDKIRSSGRLLSNLSDVVKVKGIDKELTREQMLGVALNSGNRGNIKRLLEGNKFTMEQIKNINAELTPNEKRWVDEIFKLIDSQFAGTIKTTQKIAGFTPKKIMGKYFPIVADTKLDKQARINQAKQDLFKEIFDVTFVQRGFTISRIGGRAPLQLNIMDVIWGHLEKVAHFNNMAIPVRDLQKIIHHPRFKSMVEDGLGENVYKELPRWLSDVAQPYKGALEETGAMAATFLRHNATAANLGLRVTVAAYQPFSLTLAAREVGTVNVLGGLVEFFKNPKVIKEFVDTRSIQMKTRGSFMDRDIRDLVNSQEGRMLVKGNPEKGRALFFLIRQMDLLGAYPSWLAGYRKAMRIHGDETKAARYADGVVRRTQPTGAVEDLARVMRGGAWQKTFTMFMTHFSNVHNSLVESLDDFKVAGRDPLPRDSESDTQKTGEHPFRRYSDFAASAMLIWIIPSIITEFMKSGFRWDSKRMAKAVGTYPISGLMLIRDIANYMVNGFGMGTPALSGPKSIADAVRAKSSQAKIKNAAKGIAQLTGKYPTQAVDMAMGGWDLIEGNTRDWRRLIYSEWALKPTNKPKKGEWEFKPKKFNTQKIRTLKPIKYH